MPKARPYKTENKDNESGLLRKEEPAYLLPVQGRDLLHLVDDSLEGFGIVHGEVGEHLAVDLDPGLVDKTHELGVGKVLETGGSVDTLDPEGAEIALFLLAVAVGVGETLLPGVFGDGLHIAAAAVISAGQFEYFLSLCP